MNDKTEPPVGVDKDVIEALLEERRRKEQHDLLWWSLGWLPTTLKNRVALLAAFGVAVFIGGQDLIANIITYLEGFSP